MQNNKIKIDWCLPRSDLFQVLCIREPTEPSEQTYEVGVCITSLAYTVGNLPEVTNPWPALV